MENVETRKVLFEKFNIHSLLKYFEEQVIFYGSCALYVIWEKGKIKSIHSIPIENIRNSSEKGYFVISNDFSSTTSRKEQVYKFSPIHKEEFPEQLLIIKP